MSTEGRPIVYLENTVYSNYVYDEALSQQVSSYDFRGNLIFEFSYFKADSDPYTTNTAFRTYNDNNDLLTERIEQDLSGDGVVDLINTTEYEYTQFLANNVSSKNGVHSNQDSEFEDLIENPNQDSEFEGSLSSSESTYLVDNYVFTNDSNADGKLDYIVTAEFDYNSAGQKIKEAYYQDLDGSGASIEATSITEFAYDDEGRLILETNNFQSDPNKDGVIDSASSRVTDYVYDKNDNITKIFIQEDANGDGNIDIEFTRDVTYDKRGNVLTFREFDTTQSDRTLSGYNEYDKKGNVTFKYQQREGEYWLSQEFDYDKKGNLIEKITKQNDSGSDGDPQTIETITYQYDKQGNLIREDAKNEFPGFQNPDEYLSFSSTFYEYDSRGNQTFKGVDQNGDQNIDVFQYSVYDRSNNKLLELVERDLNLDGEIDERDLKSFAYDREGDLIRELNDFGNDGSIEYEYTRQELDKEIFVSYNLPEDFPILV